MSITVSNRGRLTAFLVADMVAASLSAACGEFHPERTVAPCRPNSNEAFLNAHVGAYRLFETGYNPLADILATGKTASQ